MVDLILDGRSLGVTPVQNGQVLRLQTPIDARLHLLEIEPWWSPRWCREAVRLVDWTARGGSDCSGPSAE